MKGFSKLHLSSWQQFAHVDITFHPRLTVLTGANGSGKTTLLRLLAQHRGWPPTQMATPITLKGAVAYVTRWFRGVDKSGDRRIGSIEYTDKTAAELILPDAGAALYGVQIHNQQQVECFFIPSHRSVYFYQAVGSIPTSRKTEQQAFDEVDNTIRSRYVGSAGPPSSLFMKNTLIGWAIQGYGVRSEKKAIMPPDHLQRSAFEGFQSTLRQLLPPSLGFDELEIRNMEIVFICNGGGDEFLLEGSSGGVATIIDLAWQLFMYSRSHEGPFTVIIDEAENHLHPALQRTLLTNLLAAFPKATFIVSTHSPLIVGSVKDANVYVLRYNEDRKVESLKLDLEEKAMTASQILDEVLGVSSTLPVWAEHELQEVIRSVTAQGLRESTFSELRASLKERGLERLLPETITRTLEGSKE